VPPFEITQVLYIYLVHGRKEKKGKPVSIVLKFHGDGKDSPTVYKAAQNNLISASFFARLLMPWITYTLAVMPTML